VSTRSGSPSSLLRRLAPVLALALIAAAACSKHKRPSEDFARASELHGQLYGQELDDAYLDPRMAEVEALLQRVPSDSMDADAAHQLLERIQKSRDRVKADLAQRQKAEADALAPMRDPFGSRPPPSPQRQPQDDAGSEQDAGPSQPRLGMSLGEFTQSFSGCFQPGRTMLVEGRGMRDTWELKDIANCRDRYPGFDTLLIIIESGALSSFGDKSSIRTVSTAADGGTSGDAGTSSTSSGG
jgi:hypothetical protein